MSQSKRRDFLNALAPKVNFTSRSAPRRKSIDEQAKNTNEAQVPPGTSENTNTLTSPMTTAGSPQIVPSAAPRKGDLSVFASEEYHPELYIRATMEADTDDAIQSAIRQLTLHHEQQTNELKKTVFKNHGDLLQVGEAIVEFTPILNELRLFESQFRSSTASLIASAGIASLISTLSF